SRTAIQKLLARTVFPAHADEASRVPHPLPGGVGPELILSHAAQPPAVVSEGGKLLANPGKADAVNLWDRFHSNLPADPKVRVEHQVIVAERPGAGHILEMLDKLGCDLIVMGTDGRSWLKHLLFCSATEEVVRLARCPVMVVKPPVPAREPPMSEPEKGTKAYGHAPWTMPQSFRGGRAAYGRRSSGWYRHAAGQPADLRHGDGPHRPSGRALDPKGVRRTGVLEEHRRHDDRYTGHGDRASAPDRAVGGCLVDCGGDFYLRDGILLLCGELHGARLWGHRP